MCFKFPDFLNQIEPDVPDGLINKLVSHLEPLRKEPPQPVCKKGRYAQNITGRLWDEPSVNQCHRLTSTSQINSSRALAPADTVGKSNSFQFHCIIKYEVMP